MHPVLSQGGFLEKGEISALVMLQIGLVQLFQVVPNSTKKHRIAAEIVTLRELVQSRLEHILIILPVSAKQMWSSGN